MMESLYDNGSSHQPSTISTSAAMMMSLVRCQHQNVRVLSVEDTIDTLTRLHNRLKEQKNKPTTKRVKGLETLSLTLAMTDPSSVRTEDVVTLCQAVARCFPKLKSLEISSEIEDYNYYSCDDPAADDAAATTTVSIPFRIPLKALTVLLHPHKGLKKLRELTLDGLCFQVDDDSMRILVKAIGRHESLQKSCLYDTSMTTLQRTGRNGMEKFVSALAKKVEKLVLMDCRLAPDATDPRRRQRQQQAVWAGSCLVKIGRSTTLKELKLHNLIDLREEHIVLLSQTLSQNPHTSLRKLSILKAQVLTALPEDVVGGDTNNKDINKKLLEKDVAGPNDISSDAGTLALANMLRVNKTLQELCLNAFDFNEYSAMFLGNALQDDNLTLQNLWLMIPAHNGGTSSFPVDDQRIDYYLRLNRAGRQLFHVDAAVGQKQLLQTTKADGRSQDTMVNHDAAAGAMVRRDDDEEEEEELNHHGTTTTVTPVVDTKRLHLEWIQSIVCSKRDIDCTFYKLRKMPSLCEV